MKTKLQYQQSTIKRKRKRNIIWFNPPYSKSVKINIGEIFITLISKHSPLNHKFVKIFQNKEIKENLVILVCQTSDQKLNGHNKKILQPKPIEPQKLCNCLVKEDCSMNWFRLASSILYQATIKCSDSKYEQKRDKGICKTAFKKSYANHKKSFKLIKSKKWHHFIYGILELKTKTTSPEIYMRNQRTI